MAIPGESTSERRADPRGRSGHRAYGGRRLGTRWNLGGTRNGSARRHRRRQSEERRRRGQREQQSHHNVAEHLNDAQPRAEPEPPGRVAWRARPSSSARTGFAARAASHVAGRRSPRRAGPAEHPERADHPGAARATGAARRSRSPARSATPARPPRPPRAAAPAHTISSATLTSPGAAPSARPRRDLVDRAGGETSPASAATSPPSAITTRIDAATSRDCGRRAAPAAGREQTLAGHRYPPGRPLATNLPGGISIAVFSGSTRPAAAAVGSRRRGAARTGPPDGGGAGGGVGPALAECGGPADGGYVGYADPAGRVGRAGNGGSHAGAGRRK